MDDKELRQQETFDTLCNLLDSKKLHYNKDEEKSAVFFTLSSDDFPIELYIRVVDNPQIILLMSEIPFTVPADQSFLIAAGVTAINNTLIDGNFDYDIVKGKITYRMSNGYFESNISEDLFDYLIRCSIAMVEKFNDKLFGLAKGMLNFQDFLSSI